MIMLTQTLKILFRRELEKLKKEIELYQEERNFADTGVPKKEARRRWCFSLHQRHE